jgi:hypothetical protein
VYARSFSPCLRGANGHGAAVEANERLDHGGRKEVIGGVGRAAQEDDTGVSVLRAVAIRRRLTWTLLLLLLLLSLTMGPAADVVLVVDS